MLTFIFFLCFFFFGVKLGHFAIKIFFLYVTKMQAYQQKTEKFFVSEEKKFGRIDLGIVELGIEPRMSLSKCFGLRPINRHQ